MSTGDNSDSFTDLTDEPADESVEITPAPVADTELQPIWARRTFLKAAALGTAAAALISKGPNGLRFGPLPAAANDLSNKPCTAGDVEIVGSGTVLNEPCACSGKFNADVEFTVRNNTSTERYCVAIHLPDGRDAVLFAAPGEPNAGQSIAKGKSGGESFHDTLMIGTIKDFTCGAGDVCFGQGGVTRGKCDPGTCATIGWNTNPGAATCSSADQSPPSGQCRHQQICIRTRGDTTLDCDTSTDGVQTKCKVDCGSSPALRLCTKSDAAFGPFTFTLDGQSFGPTTDTCHDFTVGSITTDTSFTGTVTDDSGCAKSADVTLTVSAIDVNIAVSGEKNCDGNLTFTASVPGFEGCTFTWTDENGTVLGTGAKLDYRQLDGVCHTVTVSADCGGCKGSASQDVTQCVQTSLTSCGGGGASAAPATSVSSGGHKQKKHHKGVKRGKGKKGSQHGNGNRKGAAGQHHG
jgi:hypothetical protein